ncbi:MAG: hypothetical protein H7Y42_10075 [Chitinophagaceae bacterium]|nr:hypothetical protein [Chitinophagaceae bacterium]
MKQSINIIIAIGFIASLSSCAYSKKFTASYYAENKDLFHSLQERYKQQYDKQPFSVEIKDKLSKEVGLEIITDSLRYIYGLSSEGSALTDTLRKYGFNVDLTMGIIRDMQKLNCTWLTNLDYYDRLQKKYTVFVSIRHKQLESTFKKDKYFTLAMFNTPQPFDEKGRMLDNRDRKQLRKLNGAILFKLDDRTGYALTATFR